MSDIKRAQEAFRLYRENADTNYASILDLITQGVDVQATDDNKQILLHRATHNGNRDLCELLIQQGADVHAQDKWDQTPLLLAAGGGHTEVVKYLLEQKTDIHARDRWGSTPLLLAAINGHTESVKLLLAHGANIWAINDKDKTGLLQPHRDEWVGKLEAVMGRKFDVINTTQDLYHLASVMKPINPKDIPHPKEFIRILFQQYLPHEPKFNAMYAEIFGQSRPPAQDLKAAREAAKGRGVVL